jgi:hypothetical protein
MDRILSQRISAFRIIPFEYDHDGRIDVLFEGGFYGLNPYSTLVNAELLMRDAETGRWLRDAAHRNPAHVRLSA